MFFWLILPLQLFLRSQEGESSKQGILPLFITLSDEQAVLEAYIEPSQHLSGSSFWYYLKTFSHYVMLQGAPCWLLWVFYIWLCILLLLLFLLLLLLFLLLLLLLSLLLPLLLSWWLLLLLVLHFYVNIIFIISIIIRILIKSSLLFLWGKLTVWFCFFQFLYLY